MLARREGGAHTRQELIPGRDVPRQIILSVPRPVASVRHPTLVDPRMTAMAREYPRGCALGLYGARSHVIPAYPHAQPYRGNHPVAGPQTLLGVLQPLAGHLYVEHDHIGQCHA